MENLVNVVKSNFAPVVLVICSPEVEAAVKKNGISLVKLLTRFGFSPHQTKVRTIGEQPYDVRGFQVRFCSLPELEQRSSPQFEEQSQQYLSQVANYHASDRIYFDFKLRGRENINNYHRSLQTKDPTPWYTYYRWEYLRAMGVSEIECFEHPIACLLVVSSDNEKPSDTLVSLYDERNPPSVFKSGIMDPNVSKYYLMIHDCQSEKTDLQTAERKLNSMRVTFEKSKCHFVKINSLKEKNAQGTFFSSEDNQSVELFTRELIFKGIIPQMEKTIVHYNEMVESSRKGLGNKINRWFGLGSKKPNQPPIKSATTGSDSNNNTVESTVTYPLGAIENIQKRLADFLFMLQDYPEALNVYKNAIKDYLNDKSWKYYGAASEMSGLCMLLMDPMRKDLDSYLDNAYLFYVRDNLSKHVIRATIFFGDILKMRRNYSEAAAKFVRTAEREAERDRLCAGIFQEQAAFCNMMTSPPQYRKYAFRLILAGHLFSISNQVRHSYRCYASALSLYESRNWSLVDDHIYGVLAKHSFTMDRIDDAVYYIQKLLFKNSQSSNKQASILREFIHIYKKRFELKNEKLAPIPIPVVSEGSIAVFLRDYPPKSPLQDMWKEMEKSLKLDGKVLSPAMRARKLRQIKTRKNKPRLSVVGELIIVDAELKNPLQVPLQFTHVQLVGSHDSVPVPPTEVIPSENGEVPVTDEHPFIVHPFEMLLAPGEVKKLRLAITPKKEGLLSIDGIGFCLCGQVWGFKEFKLPRRRLNETAVHRKGVFYEPNMDLTIKVTRPMPLLEIDIARFPTHMYQGQIEKVILVLKNTGFSALRNVKVKLSDPTFFSFASPEMGDYALKSTSLDPSIIKIPLDVLPPSSYIEVPMWIRANKAGVFSFHFLFMYQSEIPDAEMKYRLLRITKQARIMPSIKAVATTSLSYSSINAYLLNLEVFNAQANADFKLKQVTALSPSWTIEPLSHREYSSDTKPEDLTMFNVSADQSTSLFFRIVPAESKDVIKDQKTQLYHTHNFLTSTYEVANPILPEYDFLLREKWIPKDEKDKKETVKDVSMLDLMILWETTLEGEQNLTFVGVLNVCNISFLTQTVDKAVTENAALRFSIESPRKIAHDFTKQSLCVVPVTFHINNVSNTQPLSFYLETLQPNESNVVAIESATPNFGTQKRSQYFWAETTQHYVNSLKPFGKISLQTSVVFCRPGVYNLNRYKFNLQEEHKSSTKQLREIYSPFQHIIMVEEKNEITDAEKTSSS